MVWGMVEGEENLGELKRYQDVSNKLAALSARASMMEPSVPKPLFCNHIFLPLISFIYDPSGPEEQEFQVFEEIEALG
ncbi:hypothetical protein EIP86_010980, partial [Pleurotus ostreatoroseus]